MVGFRIWCALIYSTSPPPPNASAKVGRWPVCFDCPVSRAVITIREVEQFSGLITAALWFSRCRLYGSCVGTSK